MKQKCSGCWGCGKVLAKFFTFNGFIENDVNCYKCGGSGYEQTNNRNDWGP